MLRVIANVSRNSNRGVLASRLIRRSWLSSCADKKARCANCPTTAAKATPPPVNVAERWQGFQNKIKSAAEERASRQLGAATKVVDQLRDQLESHTDVNQWLTLKQRSVDISDAPMPLQSSLDFFVTLPLSSPTAKSTCEVINTKVLKFDYWWSYDGGEPSWVKKERATSSGQPKGSCLVDRYIVRAAREGETPGHIIFPVEFWPNITPKADADAVTAAESAAQESRQVRALLCGIGVVVVGGFLIFI